MQAGKIADIVESHLKGSDKFLVDVIIKPGNRVYVFIDGDHGVTIDDCVRINRLLESKLDRDEEDFEMIVSSAGADQPLRLPRQYVKNIGRSLHLRLNDNSEMKGKLKKVDDNGILILTDGDRKKKTPPVELPVSFNEIKEAKVIISFKLT